jgi:hypothetical protein
MSDTREPRPARFSATVRGVIIGVLLTVYGFVAGQPGASFTVSLLVGAGLQAGVLLLRKLVPAAYLPQALEVYELLADAATVLLFALGVYGGILRVGYDV